MDRSRADLRYLRAGRLAEGRLRLCCVSAAIAEGLFDHRRAYPGDGGIRFEVEEGREALLAGWAFPPNRGG